MILKFKYYILLVCITLSYSASSQNIKVGIEGGPSLTSLRGNNIVEQSESLISYIIGTYVEYPISKNVFLKGGINFERKGSKNDSKIDAFNESTINNYFNYLTVPLSVKYQFEGQIKFFINVGTYIGYLLNSESVVKFKDSYDTTYLNKNFDFGVIVGTGLLIPLNDVLEFSLEFRDNFGLINISEVGVIDNGTLKTNSFNFLLGVNIKI